MTMQNLKERFEKTAQEYSGEVAIRHKKDDKWFNITYDKLGENTKSLSHFLKNKGIEKNDKISILMENRPEWPITFFAAVSIGAVCVPLNPGSMRSEVENIINDSGSKFIFTDNNTHELVKGIREKCPSIEKVISVDSNEFKDAIKKAPERATSTEISGDDITCILYTSGTTAVPKGVMLSHWNLIANCESQHKLKLITQKDSVVSILPLHHTYPLTTTMIFPLLYGCKIIYPGSMRPEVILEAMRKTKATVFVAVPQIYSAFHQKITEALKKIPFPVNLLLKLGIKTLHGIRAKTGINLSRYFLYGVHSKFGMSMRLFISGGARLDETVERDMIRFGFTILNGYGLTETSPVLTINPPEKPKTGSVGKAIPDVEIKILDENKEGIGEVAARGPNIMKGYYKRKDWTAEAIKDRWFHTGDLGYIDKEGYLFLTGRLKEVIVLSSGVNIYPDEVEEAYMSYAPVKEMCVFEVPVKKGKEEILALWAVVVPDLDFFKKYAEINLRTVIKERFDNVSRALPSHMRLMGFSITLDELPRTLLGKLQRFVVKEKYAAKALEEEHVSEKKEVSEEDLETLEKDYTRKITDYLKKQTGYKEEIMLSDLLELDLGIDSLGRVELASGLERLLGFKIEDEVIGKAFTVRDLIKGLEPYLPSGAVFPAAKEEIAFGPEYWKKTLEGAPRDENLKKIDLHPGFGAWLACFIFTCMNIAFFKVFCNLKVKGRENFPQKGPYILYANHTSYFDGLLVASSLPRFPRLDLFFVGFRPYFTVPIIRNLVRVGRIIPLDFSSHLLEAMKSCYYVLKNGKNLGLFPEGIRALNGKIGRFKKGFGILAKESGAKLVPVVIEGAFEAWPRTSKFPKRHPVTVKFGKPVSGRDMEEYGRKLGAKDTYEAICLGAREALIELKKEKG
jgi:long-chain acyl-CoA synthetase